ncbi:MAG: MFS transporter [Pseudomonadota bacterium]
MGTTETSSQTGRNKCLFVVWIQNIQTNQIKPKRFALTSTGSSKPLPEKGRFDVLRERNYRLFIAGFGISYTLYWVTLLAVAWWMWETTQSAAWVGFAFFCDLFPAVLVTPWASALADRGDRFKFLKTILWIQVVTGFTLALVAVSGWLTPQILAAFVFVEGALIGFSQPAFFGLINRLVSSQNLSAAIGFNTSVTQTTYILGPVLAGFLFSFGLEIAPIAFAANAAGTLVYLAALYKIKLHPAPPREEKADTGIRNDIIEGVNIFWTNPMVYRSMVLILGVAILQRPLISLMPGINDFLSLFDPAYFTLLTASFMAGSVIAGLLHASRNSDKGLEAITVSVLSAVIVLFASFFLIQAMLGSSIFISIPLLVLIGMGSAYVWTGNTIILQTRTAEHLRSRVLGNNFMMTRAVGAVAVILVGLLVEATDFTIGMLSVAAVVTVLVPLALLGRNQKLY